MIQVRRNVFETNSSSVHSITMCSKETYKKFSNGELFFKKYSSKKPWYTFEEMLAEIDEEDRATVLELRKNESYKFENFIEDYDFYTESNFSGEFEEFYEEFVTDSGETVVTFGYYGESR